MHTVHIQQSSAQDFDGFWSVCGISFGITKLMIWCKFKDYLRHTLEYDTVDNFVYYFFAFRKLLKSISNCYLGNSMINDID